MHGLQIDPSRDSVAPQYRLDLRREDELLTNARVVQRLDADAIAGEE